LFRLRDDDIVGSVDGGGVSLKEEDGWMQFPQEWSLNRWRWGRRRCRMRRRCRPMIRGLWLRP